MAKSAKLSNPVAIRWETVVVAAENGMAAIRVNIDDMAIHQLQVPLKLRESEN